MKIPKDDVKRKLNSMLDWEGAKPDKIHGFWSKCFAAVHEILGTVLNECIEVGDVLRWLLEGRTILVMKDSKKGTEVVNYRAIACLNLMIWKLLKGIISDKTYDHLEENRLLQKVEESAKGQKTNLQ